MKFESAQAEDLNIVPDSETLSVDFKIVNEATRLTAVSLASPIVGLALELALARVYGNTGVVDAFRLAFLMLILAMLLCTQLLPQIIIPLFYERRANTSEFEAWRLALSLNGLIAAAGLIFLMIVVAYPGLLIALFAPGLPDASRPYAMSFFRYMSAAFVLIVWTGSLSAVLNTYGLFWPGAITPLIVNGFTMALALSIPKRLMTHALGWGVLAGAMIAAFIHVFYARKISGRVGIALRDWVTLKFLNGMSSGWSVALPLAVVSGMSYLTGIILYRALSSMRPGTVAVFGYASKLIAVALMPASAIITVLFPRLAEVQANSDDPQFAVMATKSIRMTLLLTVPVSVVLWVLRNSISQFLFGWGSMSRSAVGEIAGLFGILVIALPAYAMTLLLWRLFASMQRNIVSVIATTTSLALTVLLLEVFGAGRGAVGVSIIWNIGMWVTSGILLIYLFWGPSILQNAALFIYLVKLSVMSIGAGMSAKALLMVAAYTARILGTPPEMFLPISFAGAFLVAFTIASWLNVTEVVQLGKYMAWRVKRSHTCRGRP